MGMPQTWMTYMLNYISGRSNQWTTGSRTTYLALVTADPGLSPVTPADLAEVTTAGYARQSVTWSAPAVGATPSTSNSAAVNFGPFTAAMAAAATHVALVSTASGTTGEVMYTWKIPQALAAGISETIQIPINALTMINNSNV